jgi:hypothetical protein
MLAEKTINHPLSKYEHSQAKFVGKQLPEIVPTNKFGSIRKLQSTLILVITAE